MEWVANAKAGLVRLSKTAAARPKMLLAACVAIVASSLALHIWGPASRVTANADISFLYDQYGLHLMSGQGGVGKVLLVPSSVSDPALVRVVPCPLWTPMKGVCIKVE